jgi:hypothetical protein
MAGQPKKKPESKGSVKSPSRCSSKPFTTKTNSKPSRNKSIATQGKSSATITDTANSLIKSGATTRNDTTSTTRTPGETLDNIGIDEICRIISDGATHKQTAKKCGVGSDTLHAWLVADPARIHRARETRRLLAQEYARAALDAINALLPDATPAEITKARELANHYRWLAKVTDPGDYGDRQHVEIDDITKRDEHELRSQLSQLLADAARSRDPQ